MMDPKNLTAREERKSFKEREKGNGTSIYWREGGEKDVCLDGSKNSTGGGDASESRPGKRIKALPYHVGWSGRKETPEEEINN